MAAAVLTGLKCFGSSAASEPALLDHHRSAPLQLGDPVPNFTAESTSGTMDFHQFIEGSWALLMSHPDDFTPVCTTELATAALLMPEFEKRGVKVIALSVNSLESHAEWSKDVMAIAQLDGDQLPYPIIADRDRQVAALYHMMEATTSKQDSGLACRSVFIIDPEKKLKMMQLYSAATGRDFGEIIRVIDSLQRTAVHQVATPVNWRPSKDCMVLPSVSNDEAALLFKQGVTLTEIPSGKNYLRQVPDPAMPAGASAKTKRDDCVIC